MPARNCSTSKRLQSAMATRCARSFSAIQGVSTPSERGSQPAAAYRLARRRLGRCPSGAGAAVSAILDGAMPLTCLVVDDSLEFFEAARQLLAEDGVTVVGFAATSDEAVEEA